MHRDFGHFILTLFFIYSSSRSHFWEKIIMHFLVNKSDECGSQINQIPHPRALFAC